jgi:UrcA family protein
MNTSRLISSRRLSAATLAAIACTLTGCIGHAEPRAEYRTVRVSYADLDLAKPAGAEALYRRIKAAARKVCGPPETREAIAHQRWRDCYDHAISQAVLDINRQALTALHEATHDEPTSASRSGLASSR